MILSIMLLIAYFFNLFEIVHISVKWNRDHPLFSPASRRVAAASSHLSLNYSDDVRLLTSHLVDIPSVTDDEAAVFDYAENWLRAHNLTVRRQNIDAAHCNLLAYAKGAKLSDIRIVLSTHLDTVPFTTSKTDDDEEEEEEEEDNRKARYDTASHRLYGRGSVDAKGQAAAMMITMLNINFEHHRHIALLLLSAEERGHIGMSHAHNFNLPYDITLINGEPTELNPVRRQKGMISAKVSSIGKAAHSGYPHLGRSAIDNLLNVLERLREKTSDGSDKRATEVGSTMNVGVITGGSAPNIIAPIATATVVWRVNSDTRGKMRDIEEVVSGYTHVNVSIKFDKFNEPLDLYVPRGIVVENNSDGEDLKDNVVVVAYNTDIPYYQRKTRFNILFGAGSIEQAHSNDEFIDVAQLERLPGMYQRIAEEMLAVYDDEDGDRDGDGEGGEEKEVIDVDELGSSSSSSNGGGSSHDEV